jgi:hypothetical protein
MTYHSIADWFTEREQKMKPLAFMIEWVFMFILALMACALFFFSQGKLAETAMVSTAISALLACVFVYVRMFKATGCDKCGSPLPLLREEVDRKHIRDARKFLELARSWSQGPASMADIYSKICRIEKVRFRCKRCKHEWAEEQQTSLSMYRFHHSINLNDQL